jgi:RimJ/RimL family protein N-acetyltransferase
MTLHHHRTAIPQHDSVDAAAARLEKLIPFDRRIEIYPTPIVHRRGEVFRSCGAEHLTLHRQIQRTPLAKTGRDHRTLRLHQRQSSRPLDLTIRVHNHADRALAATAAIGHSGAVSQLHPAVTAPLRDVVTRRLLLRRLGDENLDELATMFANPDVWRFEYDRGLTCGETQSFLDRQTRLWDECGFGGCAVTQRAVPDLVGVAGLGVPTIAHVLLPEVTVGWRFSPAAWGQGYATESATALLREAFTTMGLDRVGCVTNAENHRSIAVAERLGMSLIADTQASRDDGTGTVTARLMQLTRADWMAGRDDRDAHA